MYYRIHFNSGYISDPMTWKSLLYAVRYMRDDETLHRIHCVYGADRIAS